MKQFRMRKKLMDKEIKINGNKKERKSKERKKE
jgi:hypothetical protein